MGAHQFISWNLVIGLASLFYAFLTILIAGFAVVFHALVTKASDDTVNIFIEGLRPPLKRWYATFLERREGTIISNFLGMLFFSFFPIAMITFLIILITIPDDNSSEGVAYIIGAWTLFDALVLIRAWLFGIKFYSLVRKKVE